MFCPPFPYYVVGWLVAQQKDTAGHPESRSASNVKWRQLVACDATARLLLLDCYSARGALLVLLLPE